MTIKKKQIKTARLRVALTQVLADVQTGYVYEIQLYQKPLAYIISPEDYAKLYKLKELEWVQKN